MFQDKRSKKVIVLAHCLLNQNSLSDGTADLPGQFTEIIEKELEKTGINIRMIGSKTSGPKESVEQIKRFIE